MKFIYSVIKTIILSKFKVLKYLKYDFKINDELLILGNGPSLKTDAEKLLQFKEKKDCLGVNYFAASQLFEVFKPAKYVIVSGEYWKGDVLSKWHNDRMKLFEEMINRCNWEMILYVPAIAMNDKNWQLKMKTNSKIKIRYINLTPLEGSPNLVYPLLKNFLGLPRPHNVIVPSIVVGLNCGYSKIYLSGVDHSWLEEVSVDEKNNVLIGQKHFYGSEFKNRSSLLSDKKKPVYWDGSGKSRKLHEVLLKFYFAFRSYWELNELSKIYKSKIINLTENSYIDAFERQNLS